MTSRVDVLLASLAGKLQTLTTLYEQGVQSHVLSDELLERVRYLVVDLHSAFDWTATDLDREFGRAVDRSPYFPLWVEPDKFARAMKADFSNVPQAVADAMERAQPYHPNRSALAHLHKLSKVNKHQDFSEQTRTETRRWRQQASPGASVEWGEGVSWTPGSVFVGNRPMGDPATTTVTIFVGWNFTAPPVPVLQTLTELVEQTTEAVGDVRHAADL